MMTVLTVAGLFIVITFVFNRFRVENSFLPENNLPIMLITGTVALLLTVAALVIIFARLDLTRWENPLGLPDGSVRAVIALLLILLFFITAVFLYADVGRNGADRVLTGISQVRFDAIPTEQIQDSRQRAVGTTTVYDVTLTSPKNQDSRDIAKQLVTTVSTLVVAIAAFYFGSNSVQGATTKATTAAASPPGGTGSSQPSTTSPATGDQGGAATDTSAAAAAAAVAAATEALVESARPQDAAPA